MHRIGNILTNFWKTSTRKRLEIIPIYNTRCSKNSQDIQESGNILYDAIKPIFILTQWLGLFLVANLESSARIKPATFISILRIPGLIIIGYQIHYILNTFSSISQVLLKIYWEDHRPPNLRMVMILYDRLNGLFILFYLILASKKFPIFFSKWKTLNPLLQTTKGSLRRLSLAATTISLILALAQTSLLAEFQEDALSIYSAIYLWTCFVLNYGVLFIQACFLIFAKALRLGFEAVTAEMEELFHAQSGTSATFDKDHFSKRISKIRQNHHHLCILAKATTDVLHPALFVVIISIVLSQLAAFYGLYTVIRQFNDLYSALIALLIYVIVIRILPLAVMCHLGETVRAQSVAGKAFLYQVSSKWINEDGKLQLRLFESKLNNQSAKLNASGYLNIDYRLFIQIAGVTYTYILVTIQYIQYPKYLNTSSIRLNASVG